MSDRSRYWFRAKRYGFGWGVPTAWQGWAVYLLWFCLLLAGERWLRSAQGDAVFGGYAVLLVVLLLAVGWWKGEPSGWR
jgi:hypothetical protein